MDGPRRHTRLWGIFMNGPRRHTPVQGFGEDTWMALVTTQKQLKFSYILRSETEPRHGLSHGETSR